MNQGKCLCKTHHQRHNFMRAQDAVADDMGGEKATQSSLPVL